MYADLLSVEWRVFQNWIESGTLQSVHHLVATVHLQWAGFEVGGTNEEVLRYWFSVLQGLQDSGLKLVHSSAGFGSSVLKQAVNNAHSSYTLSWVNTRHWHSDANGNGQTHMTETLSLKLKQEWSWVCRINFPSLTLVLFFYGKTPPSSGFEGIFAYFLSLLGGSCCILKVNLFEAFCAQLSSDVQYLFTLKQGFKYMVPYNVFLFIPKRWIAIIHILFYLRFFLEIQSPPKSNWTQIILAIFVMNAGYYVVYFTCFPQ